MPMYWPQWRLQKCRCHEATGVYWKLVFSHILNDGDFTLVLANATTSRTCRPQETDVNDATCLAELLAHGLIGNSFVPDAVIQVLRNMLRTPKQLVREKTARSSDYRRRWRMRTSSSVE